MMKKTNIAFVFPEPIMGGTTRTLLDLLATIDYSKFDITVFFVLNEGDMKEAFYENKNIKIQEIEKKKSYSFFHKKIPYFFVRLIRRIAHILTNKRAIKNQITNNYETCFFKKNDKKFDFVVGFDEGIPTNVVYRIFNYGKKIYWFHTDYSKAGRSARMDQKIYKSAYKIVTVSQQNKDNLCNLHPLLTNVLYIPNILDANRILKQISENSDVLINIDKNYINFLTTSRIDNNSKGLDRAVKAIYEISLKKEIRFRWYIIGDGRDKEKMEELIKDYKLESRIFLLGKSFNPFPHYHKFDFFFLPSIYEGWGLVVDEALVCGLPCVVTNYAPAKEQIDSEKKGIIIENSFEGIYDFLSELSKENLPQKTAEKLYFGEEKIDKINILFEILN